jgi:hypothetical protein
MDTVELVLVDLNNVPYDDEPIVLTAEEFVQIAQLADDHRMTLSGYISHVLAMGIIETLEKKVNKRGKNGTKKTNNRTTSRSRYSSSPRHA